MPKANPITQSRQVQENTQQEKNTAGDSPAVSWRWHAYLRRQVVPLGPSSKIIPISVNL